MSLRRGGVFGRRLLALTRLQKRLILLTGDFIIMVVALWLAMSLRLGTLDIFWFSDTLWLYLLCAGAGAVTFWLIGFYSVLLRLLDSQAVLLIGAGASAAAIMLVLSAYLFPQLFVPRSVPIIYAIVIFLLVGGSRLLARMLYWYLLGTGQGREPILIYGAGMAGTQLAQLIRGGVQYKLVGFLDDDKTLRRTRIRNVPVYHSSKVDKLAERYTISRIFLAMPSASQSERRAAIERIRKLKVNIQTVPPMDELIDGTIRLDEMKSVSVDDLLGRAPVPPLVELFEEAISGRNVMITGAGGSIGSELSVQLLAAGAKKLVLFDSSEFNLYSLEQRLSGDENATGQTDCVYALGSVLDAARVGSLIGEHDISLIYHAAAYKHVPLVEDNPLEGIRVNLFGTKTVAEAAIAKGVERFVLISTDKAVRPTSVMGASKRLAEMCIQHLQASSQTTTLTMVRFGNVLGSSGSVIPLFQRQIREGGPVTVTHAEVMRYFMTIPEAAQLVVQAGFMAKGGEVFLLEMGDPVKIIDLARLMIQLSGLTPREPGQNSGEIEIQVTGLRPGEKLFEELLIDRNAIGTDHPKIMQGTDYVHSSVDMVNLLKRLEKVLKSRDTIKARQIIAEVVEEFPQVS